MIVLRNQTLYRCEYCNHRRMLSPGGSRLHESSYCKGPDSPHQKAIRERREQCTHENTMPRYVPMAGESHLLEPDHDECMDCGAKV